MATIAVVDDQKVMRDMMAAALGRCGYDVVTANNGREARERLSEQEVDLLITDIFMPGEDGIEVLRQVRTIRSQLPVIAVSGGGQHIVGEVLSFARMLGAQKVLAKPFAVGELMEAVRTLLVPSETTAG